MKFSAILVACAAYLALVSCDQPQHCCSGTDRKIVQKQWNSVFNNPHRGYYKKVLGKEIFKKFFEKEPATIEIFKRLEVTDNNTSLDSPSAQAAITRGISGLDGLINLFQDVETLKGLADIFLAFYKADDQERLRGQNLKSLGLSVGEVLDQVIDDFDRSAWRNCFEVIGKYIRERIPAN